MRLARGGCVRPVAVVRFYRNVLCSAHAGRAVLLGCLVFVRAHHTFLSGCLMLDHACCLPHERQTERLAICSVPIPPWVVIAGSAFSNRQCGHRISWVHFGLARFFMAIPTENEGTGERGERRERRTESAARQSAFLRDRISFAMFSAGSPLGAECGSRTAAAPKPAPRRLVSLDSLHLIRGVGALYAAKGTRV